MLSDLTTYPRITVPPLSFRLALLQMILYDQMSGTFNAFATREGILYFEYTLSIASDNPYFTEDNTSLSEAQMYSAFQLAATL